MKINGCLFVLLISCISCAPKDVSLDPHYPNTNITPYDLEHNGWRITVKSCGMCVYEAEEKSNPQLSFTAESFNNCKPIESQYLSTDLNYSYVHSLANLADENSKLIRQPELEAEIDGILERYDSYRDSDLLIVNDCYLEFFSKNKNGVRINWTISNFCQDLLPASAKPYPNTMSTYAKLL